MGPGAGLEKILLLLQRFGPGPSSPLRSRYTDQATPALGSRKYSEKPPCLNATLSPTNCTWTGLGFNTGLRSERPVARCLSQGTALFFTWILAKSSYLCCYCDLAVGVAAVLFQSPVCLTELPVFCVRNFM